MSQSYDTIVVGLGAAGVTAAATLAKAGRRVLALDAQDYIGGRVKSVRFGDGVVELGAEWVHGQTSSRVYETAVQHNIPLVAQDLDLLVYQSDGVKPPQDFQDTFNELVEYMFVAQMEPSDTSEPLGQFLTRKLMEHLKSEKPEMLRKKEFLKQLLEWMNQLMNNYNASNDWNDLDSRGTFETLEGHQHLSWHKYGYNKLFDILLNGDMGFPTLDLKLNSEVIQIEWSHEPDQNVNVTCKNGVVYTAKNVIVTVSLGVLKERHTRLFKPNLPEEKIKAIERIPFGVMDKIDLSFDQVWWPLDAVFFGFLWKEGDRQQVPLEDYWTTKVFAASRPMGAKNVLTLWTSGEVARVVETMPIDAVQAKCKQLLERFMNNNKPIPEPTGIERTTWATNPFTKGSYSYCGLTSAPYTTARADLASPIVDLKGNHRILFAGEATHDTRYSTVHGACDTGYKEAMRLLPGASKI